MDILENPFHILGVALRDGRRRIMEMAEEKILAHEHDEDVISSAANALMNPRKRLAAEVAWLPGLAPKNALDCVSQLRAFPHKIIALDNVPPLAKANLLAGCLIQGAKAIDSSKLPKWIVTLAEAFDGIDKQALLVSINESREISGFPKVSDVHALQHELEIRRQYYRSTVVNSLNHLPIHRLAKVVTNIVESTTDKGNTHAPIIIDDLVDSYAIKVQEFLGEEEQKIDQLLSRIHKKAVAGASDAELSSLVDELISNIGYWDTVAQPIQVSTKSLGLEHDMSMGIALKIRKTAIFLFNEHGQLELCQRITTAMQEVFAEVIDVAEIAEQDMQQLNKKITKPELFFNRISTLCTQAVETATKNPSAAYLEAQKLNKAAPQLLSKLKNENAPDALIHQGKDIVAAALMRCAVIFGNETNEWLKCVKTLENAMIYAESKEVIKQIRSNWLTAKKGAQYKFSAKRFFLLFVSICAVIGSILSSFYFFPTAYRAVFSFFLESYVYATKIFSSFLENYVYIEAFSSFLEKRNIPRIFTTTALLTFVIYSFVRFLYRGSKLTKLRNGLPSGFFIYILFVCFIWSAQIHPNTDAKSNEVIGYVEDTENLATVTSEAERAIRDMTKPEIAPIEPITEKIETGDEYVLAAAIQEIINAQIHIHNDYLKKIDSLALFNYLDSAFVNENTNFTPAFADINKWRGLLENYHSSIDALNVSNRNKISEIDERIISARVKSELLESLDRDVSIAKAHNEKMFALERESIDAIEMILFLLARSNNWTVENENFIFFEESELAEFNFYVTKIEKLAARREALLKEIRQYALSKTR